MSKAPASAAATGLPRAMNEAQRLAHNLMLAGNYRHLEYSIPELKSAAIVLETVMDRTLGTPAEFHGLKRFDLTEDQWDGLIYAIHHVGNLARQISTAYFRGFETPIDGSAES